MENLSTCTPKHIQIIPRKPEFDFSLVEKVWGNDEISTHFINTLSILIPYCERTVNEILRKDLPHIQDHELRLHVQNMIKQEGQHSVTHRKANEFLGQRYKGLALIEKIQKSTINLIRSLSSRAFERTMPIAFEHFASAVSREVLSNQARWIGNKKIQQWTF